MCLGAGLGGAQAPPSGCSGTSESHPPSVLLSLAAGLAEDALLIACKGRGPEDVSYFLSWIYFGEM